MFHPEKYVLQWGMGFAKEHTFLNLLLENICEYYPFFKGKSFAVPKNAILSLTGPGMFTKTLREYLDTNEDADLMQAGIDVKGHGIYSLKGSEVRYATISSYASSKNSPIAT